MRASGRTVHFYLSIRLSHSFFRSVQRSIGRHGSCCRRLGQRPAIEDGGRSARQRFTQVFRTRDCVNRTMIVFDRGCTRIRPKQTNRRTEAGQMLSRESECMHHDDVGAMGRRDGAGWNVNPDAAGGSYPRAIGKRVRKWMYTGPRKDRETGCRWNALSRRAKKQVECLRVSTRRSSTSSFNRLKLSSGCRGERCLKKVH